MDNIKAALAAFSVATITRISGHILVTFSVSGEAERAFPLIAKVPGSPASLLRFIQTENRENIAPRPLRRWKSLANSIPLKLLPGGPIPIMN